MFRSDDETKKVRSIAELEAAEDESAVTEESVIGPIATGVDFDTLVEGVTTEPQSGLRTVGATLTQLAGLQAGKYFVLERKGGVLGRGEGADFSFSDSAVSRTHARIRFVRGDFYIADMESRNGTFVDDIKVGKPLRLPSHCRIRLGSTMIVQFSALDELGLQATEELTQTLLVDPLTRTGNRLHLIERLHAEINFARRHHVRFAVMLLDLDHFKSINDRFGHVVGDQVLHEVGSVLLRQIRAEDAVFRYGGEEFCILVRNLPNEGLMTMAHRLRQAINDVSIPADDGAASVTVSIGIAKLLHDELDNQKDLMLRADRALYRAKDEGRNRVVLAVKEE